MAIMQTQQIDIGLIKKALKINKPNASKDSILANANIKSQMAGILEDDKESKNSSDESVSNDS